MARKFAAIMASLGMTLVLLRALYHGGGVEAAITSGVFWMICLGLIGYTLGAIARTTVDDSVRLSMQYEIAIAHGQAPGDAPHNNRENGFSITK